MCIVITIVMLNDLELNTTDIMNAYVTLLKEKLFTMLGTKWGQYQEGRQLFSMFYSLKSSI